MRSVLNLVTGELLRNALSKGAARLDRFWDGSLFTAQVCQKLSQRLRIGDPQTAYLFGLFHDCAIPVLMQRFPDYIKTLQDANKETDVDFTVLEDQRHGTNHCAVGYMLAKSWGLPTSLSQAILSHHDYDVFAVDSGVEAEVCRYIALGAIAERAISMQRRMVEEGGWIKAGPAIGLYLGMDEIEMSDLFEDLSTFVSELSAAT
jgi:HD-like signal output (HDOD) protein